MVLKGLRLLIVDDDEDTREGMACLFEQAGAAVETAATVDAAVRLLSITRTDVVLADIGLRGRDGYALIGAVRDHAEPHVRAVLAIAVTGHAGPEHRARALSGGYDEHIVKPVDPDRLLGLVSRIANVRAAARVGQAGPSPRTA